MTDSFFKDQIRRCRMRFGDKAFDNEFIMLVWREVCTMSDLGFQRLVDILIGHRASGKAPLLADFREGRLNEEKVRFNNEVKAASNAMDWPSKEGLKNYLAKEYSGARSLNEAVQIQVLRNQIKQSEEGA